METVFGRGDISMSLLETIARAVFSGAVLRPRPKSRTCFDQAIAGRRRRHDQARPATPVPSSASDAGFAAIDRSRDASMVVAFSCAIRRLER